MKLDELIPQNKTYQELQGLWLVFDAQLLPQLIAAQNPNDTMKVQPVPLNDGRYFLSADCITETGEQGIFRPTFTKLNQANFEFVDVLTTEELEPFKIVDVDV